MLDLKLLEKHSTATWTISKLDSLGNPVVKKIDMKLVKGSYIVEPH